MELVRDDRFDPPYNSEPDPLYEVTLADGTTFSDLEKNGTCYIYSGEIDPAVFKRNLSTVTITAPGVPTEELQNQRLALCQPYHEDPSKTIFGFYEVSGIVKAIEDLQSRQDYMGMMLDV